jgi:hypothetical protein
MKAKKVFEKFVADSDPIKDMGIGIFYKQWRIDHNHKPIITYIFYLIDPMNNKKRYIFFIYYAHEVALANERDSIYFRGERLIGGWEYGSGTGFALSNMQNKPDRFFDSAEDTSWLHSKVFEKDVIDNLKDEKSAEKMINDISNEWFEEPIFLEMMKKWFKTGVMRIDHIEMKIHK